MNSKLRIAVFLACCVMFQMAHARVTGLTSVVQIGGQITNFFIDISETVGDDVGCPGKRIVIPEGAFGDAEAKKRLFTAVTMALATGAKMQLAVSGCVGNFPTMIDSDFWFLQPR